MFEEFEDRIKNLLPLFEKSVIRIMVDVRSALVDFYINTEHFTIPEDEMATFNIPMNQAHDFAVFLAKNAGERLLGIEAVSGRYRDNWFAGHAQVVIDNSGAIEEAKARVRAAWDAMASRAGNA